MTHFPLNRLAITLSLCSYGVVAYADGVQILEKQAIEAGTQVNAMNADGTILGLSTLNDRNAIYNTQTGTSHNLGTLRTDRTGLSSVGVVSSDGKIAGGWAFANDNTFHPTLWQDENWRSRTDLYEPNFETDGGVVSAISHDKTVLGGQSSKRGNVARATLWSGDNWQQQTNLAPLTTSAISEVRALSADGKIVGGWSQNSAAESRPVIWSGNDYAVQELGTLKTDNTGNGTVRALSHNGAIAGGFAQNDDDNDRAVIWSGIQYNKKTDLGTLKSDNTGNATVYALSADGKIAGGQAVNDDGEERAVIWSGRNYGTKTDLGTLASDNTGNAIVRALSHDGTVAGGQAMNDDGDNKAVLWKLSHPTAPAIDVENTQSTIAQLGADTFDLMTLQHHSLDRLQHACRTDSGLCIGVQQDFGTQKTKANDRMQDITTSLNVGYGFGNGLSVGVALNHNLDRKLPQSYRHTGDDVGVGATFRFDAPTGLYTELSGAYDDYQATITRPTLANTELGVNETTIKGKAYGLKIGKQLMTDQNLHHAYIGVKHHDVYRGAYQENDQTDFPIAYDKVQHKATQAVVGAGTKIVVGDHLAWVVSAEVARQIAGDDPTYRATLAGVDEQAFLYTPQPKKTTGQLAIGVRHQASPTTYLELVPYVKKHGNGQTGYGALLSLESQF